MPAWLLSGLKWIAQLLLAPLAEKLGAAIAAAIARLKSDKKADDSSKASVDPLQKAQTPEEIDRAADDALNGV